MIFQEPSWRSSTLLCDKAIAITINKTYIFADSVLCLGSISDQLVEAWKNEIKWYLENRYLKDLNRIDEEPMEFEWMIELQREPVQSEGRIIVMSMFKDIVWGERGNTEKCETNSVTAANYVRRFPLGRWSFQGLGSEKKRNGIYSDKPYGKWDKTAERMMLNFAESGHPIFRATSALER